MPQPALASWLADELSAGCADIARRLFPQLSYVNTVTSGGFGLYAQRLVHAVDEREKAGWGTYYTRKKPPFKAASGE